MRKEDLKDWTRDKMKDEILRLEKENKELDRQNTDIQNSHMKFYNDTKEEIRRLKEENEALKTKIQKLVENQREDCSCEDDLPFPDDEVDTDDYWIYKLPDRHQQDCIRINDLTTTINVLSGLYVNLRKNVGMD